MNDQDDLAKAHELANIADAIGMKYYLSRDLKVTTKPDSSPVTQADTEIEEALSKIVVKEYSDSYFGEEGTISGNGSRRWLVDPIDGTKNFLRSFPVWGSLISLRDGDKVLSACVSAPAMGRRWWASKSGGAWTRDVNGSDRKIQVSGVDKVSNSFLLHGNFNSYEEVGLSADKVFSLIRSAYRHRAPGDFFGYVLVAEGAADGFVEVPSALWDLEAPKFILEQAGGSVWSKPNDLTTVRLQRLAIATNSLIENEILNYLKLK